MANINDYLDWRGDIVLSKEYPFNEVDNMILARFSYLIFDRIEMKEKETIESISKKMKSFKNEEFHYNGDKDLITRLGKSKRFKNMIVTDYIKNNDSSIEKQFSAITIHISDKEIYVSFFGTDKSIIGWKEDFNISFMDNVPSQVAGKEYTEMIAKKYIGTKIRIGGHSKGGNIAIYSAISIPKEIQNRVISVVNYDGPGFGKEKIEENKNKEIMDKIFTYIPQESVFGRILEHAEKCEVVLSTEKGIYQHDLFSWQVMRDKMIRVDNVTKASDRMNTSIKNWLKNTTPEQRKIFFDSMFELFYSTSANTFGDINWLKNMPNMISTFKGLSEEDKKTLTEMLKLFGKYYFSIKN